MLGLSRGISTSHSFLTLCLKRTTLRSHYYFVGFFLYNGEVIRHRKLTWECEKCPSVNSAIKRIKNRKICEIKWKADSVYFPYGECIVKNATSALLDVARLAPLTCEHQYFLSYMKLTANIRSTDCKTGNVATYITQTYCLVCSLAC